MGYISFSGPRISTAFLFSAAAVGTEALSRTGLLKMDSDEGFTQQSSFPCSGPESFMILLLVLALVLDKQSHQAAASIWKQCLNPLPSLTPPPTLPNTNHPLTP